MVFIQERAKDNPGLPLFPCQMFSIPCTPHQFTWHGIIFPKQSSVRSVYLREYRSTDRHRYMQYTSGGKFLSRCQVFFAKVPCLIREPIFISRPNCLPFSKKIAKVAQPILPWHIIILTLKFYGCIHNFSCKITERTVV